MSFRGPASPPPPSCSGTLTAIDSIDSTLDGSFNAILWMSESTMQSASLSASNLVAVSVLSSGAREAAGDSHLESLGRLCEKHFGIVVDYNLNEEPGDFYAIATAWPCRKLLKDSFRLSRQLANTIGYPTIGTKILVSLLNVCDTNTDVKSETLLMNLRSTMRVVSQECKHLRLRWCYPGSLASVRYGARSPSVLIEACSGKSGALNSSPLPFTSETSNREGSPQTPASKWQAKPTSNSKRAVLEASSPTPRRDVRRAAMYSVSSILDGRSSEGRELLERFAARILSDRFLLIGNFVIIPICGHTCVFRVVEAGNLKHSMQMTGEGTVKGLKRASASIWQANKVLSQIPTIYHAGVKTSIDLLPPLAFQTGTADSISVDKTSNPTCGKGVAVEKGLWRTTMETVKFSELGGLSEKIAAMKEIIQFSLLHPELLLRLGLQPTRGVLLYGPPGTGKTSLALASAREAGTSFFLINGPEIISEFYGESEGALQKVFASAQISAPSVVFIDELDAIAPQRKEGIEELAQRMVAALLTLMDGGVNHSLHRVLVIAATNRLETIDPALRRPGRFDCEVEIGVPSPGGRHEILQVLLSKMNHTLTTGDVKALASVTHGFVGADLTALCNEAALLTLRRYADLRFADATASMNIKNQQDIASQVDEVTWCLDGMGFSNKSSLLARTCSIKECEGIDEALLKISIEAFEEVKPKIRPSAMREVMLEVPQVHWSDIGGHEEVKQQLQEAVEWPQKHGDAFVRIGTYPPRGVLMYGPPGCSKTLMARAVATESNLNFIAVKGPELFSKWVGESEKAVHLLFERARAAAPSVIFFDEIDGLAVQRDHGHAGVSVGGRVMSQLLVEMDGLNPRIGVAVIAATNRPDKVDSALLRPGRFDRLLYVGPPNEGARQEIFEIHTRKMPCSPDVSKKDLAVRTFGYTGADIAAVCQEAALAALEEDLCAEQVLMRHFEAALSTVQPSHSDAAYSLYAQFQRGWKSAWMEQG